MMIKGCLGPVKYASYCQSSKTADQLTITLDVAESSNILIARCIVGIQELDRLKSTNTRTQTGREGGLESELRTKADIKGQRSVNKTHWAVKNTRAGVLWHTTTLTLLEQAESSLITED